MSVEYAKFNIYEQKICCIMRGIPGSFKTTFAKIIASRNGTLEENLVDNVFYYNNPETKEILSVRHSTDQYFMINGEYKFNPSLLGKFHGMNYKAFRNSCEDGIPLVICDNTNIITKNYKKYIDTAKHQGYIISTCMMDIPTLTEAAERNTHDVPKEAIHKMRQRLLQVNK